MPGPAEIVAEYDRREKAAGGVANVEPKAVAYDVARHFDIAYAEVREVLLTAWTGPMGAG